MLLIHWAKLIKKMKILVFGGGLGNQIFGYAFTEYIRTRFPKQKVLGVYNQSYLSEHYGLEVNKWFDVRLPESRWYVSALTYLLYAIKKLTGWKRLLDLNQNVMEKDNALVYFAQHTDKRYIPEGEWLHFKIDDNTLGGKNVALLREIRHSEAVFVHVRRGDYLSPKYIDRFKGCCTLDYYNLALHYVSEHVENPRYYVFSNDIEWTKKNLKINNPTYVDWNTDERSPIDMYLMSQCRYGIIANSTFSYWGAMLGDNKLIVTYPGKWINPPFSVGDIFPEDWIKL